MPNRSLLRGAALAFCLCLPCVAAIAEPPPPKGSLDQAEPRRLDHAGEQRGYLIARPLRQAGTAAPALVVLLHGGTQTARQVWTQTSLPTLAAREGFILVAPEGLRRHWNDARGSTVALDGPSTADDVGFLKAVIAEVIERDGADRHAVFMAGVSNGGFMTMRFACEAAELLGGAASISATLPTTLAAQCRPARPLPWLAINGSDDPIIPFAGQPAAPQGLRTRPALLSADASFAFWAGQAGCTAEQTVGWIGAAERRERQDCSGAARSVQYVLHGAGHAAPGLEIRSRLGERVVGRANHDIDAGTVVWAHFRALIGR